MILLDSPLLAGLLEIDCPDVKHRSMEGPLGEGTLILGRGIRNTGRPFLSSATSELIPRQIFIKDLERAYAEITDRKEREKMREMWRDLRRMR